jgi:hypothetical protein
MEGAVEVAGLHGVINLQRSSALDLHLLFFNIYQIARGGSGNCINHFLRRILSLLLIRPRGLGLLISSYQLEAHLLKIII